MKYQTLLNRFIKFISFDTRSDEKSNTVPSTISQVLFAKNILIPELQKIGLKEIKYNEHNGFTTALLSSNLDYKTAKIGFIAHIDTADFESANIKPRLIENYDGQDIVLNVDKSIIMSVKDFPNLKKHIGKTLIVTDGTTLLGADDKAGVAEIITAMEYLINHPEIKHGDIKVAFGPDEEIGRGADLFDVEDFGCDFAYTVDGGPLGELEWESFNAAGAKVIFKGKNVHPGSAKNKMINAITLANDFLNQLPKNEVPELTDKKEGFYHVFSINGNVEEATIELIIRDHDKENFIKRKEFIKQLCNSFNTKRNQVEFEIHDQYYNMGEILSKDKTPVNIAKQAMENLGIEVDIKPIRGGTDGSKLSFMGLPCPNIFAGGENFHGRYEFIPYETMERATDVIVEIAKSIANENNLKK